MDFLPEVRLVAELKAVTYKDLIGKAYIKRVWERPLRLRDLMLRRITATGKAHTDGKLTTNWEGTYQIAKEIGHGSFALTTMDGVKLKNCGMSAF